MGRLQSATVPRMAQCCEAGPSSARPLRKHFRSLVPEPIPQRMLDRAAIARRSPHQGRMCLLERVLDWDAAQIRCGAVSHRDAGNPLRAHDRLAAACGIEYAAQAMAVHGSLLSFVLTL